MVAVSRDPVGDIAQTLDMAHVEEPWNSQIARHYVREYVTLGERGARLPSREFLVRYAHALKATRTLLPLYQAARDEHQAISDAAHTSRRQYALELTDREAAQMRALLESQAPSDQAPGLGGELGAALPGERTLDTIPRSDVGELDDQGVNPVPTRREMFGYIGMGLLASGLERIGVPLPGGHPPASPRVLHALEVTRRTAAPNLDYGTVEDLTELVEHYARTFRRTSPVELYGEILGVRAYAGSLLSSMPTPSEHPDLVIAVGWLSNLLALVTHDLGDHAAALVWCADAERHGQEAGHPELAGWAAQTRVLMAFYDGQAREAVVHARQGQAVAPIGTVAHAKLVAQEMRAWALLGDAQMVRDTRRRAEETIAKLPSETPTQGAFSISLAADPPYTATSLLLLGQLQESAELIRQVIATHYGPGGRDGPGEHPAGFALAHLRLAFALAGLGRLDEAHSAGTTALDTPRPVRPVVVLAGELDRTLTRDFGDTAEARDYHERYAAVRRTQPLALPAGGEPDVHPS